MLLFLAFFGMSLDTVSASVKETRAFGVKIGDWVKYGSFVAEYDSTDPDASEVPPHIVEHNRIDWINNTVVNFNNSMVSFESLVHFKNNNTYAQSVEKVDIETGYNTHELRAAFMFVSGNLEEGDSIYGGEYLAYKINETIFSNYLQGKSRKTNHLYGSTVTPLAEEDNFLTMSVDYYWDRETGILCEYLGGGTLVRGQYTTSLLQSFRIIDTNIEWVGQDDAVPDGWVGYSPVIVGVVVALVSVPVVYFLWRRKDKRRRKKRRKT